MKKLKTVLLLILVISILSSCVVGTTRTEMLNENSEEKNADIRLEQIVDLIKTEDKDGIKLLFSKKVLEESNDIDDNIKKLFDFVQGDIEAWKKTSGPTIFESNNYGNRTTEVSSYYQVVTNEKEYFFLVEDYTVDTECPDNVGLSLLLVVEAKDYDKIYDEDNKIIYDKIVEDGEEKVVKLSRIGVYIPLDE